MKNILWILLSAALLMSCNSKSPPSDSYADLVIRHARIWTAEPDQPWASALAIKGERIVAIGDDSAVTGLIGPQTELIDSPAGLVVPGFIDSHVHMMSSGYELSSVQLRDAQTPEEFAQLIGDFAAGLQAGEWLLGGTWDHQNWGGELPRRDWIDAVTPDTPVMVLRLDGHMALANSLALKLAGIDQNTVDVDGGEIVRDADGMPTGLLKDNAMTPVFAVIPVLSAEVAANGRGDDWLRIGGLKGFMDGSLGSHTAAFFEPFTDTPDDRGFFITEPGDVQQWAVAAAGVIPSMQPYHAIDDGRWAEAVIGPDRARYTYAFGSLFDAGVPVAFGSDWSVAPASPVLGIYAATTRQTLDGGHPGYPAHSNS